MTQTLRDYIIQEQNEIMRRQRAGDHAQRFHDARMNRVKKSYERAAGSPTSKVTVQRGLVEWLFRNEVDRYKTHTAHAGHQANSRTRAMEAKREEVIKVTLANLPETAEHRGDIEPVFQRVFNEIMGGIRRDDNEYYDPEADAVAQFAKPEQPSAPKEELPEGLKRDKNGKLRYASGNPWGKTPGSIASESVLSGDDG